MEAEAGLTDSEITPCSLCEVEAEAVALICLEALGLQGARISAQRIFKAADQILEAGTADAIDAGATS